MTNPVLTEVKIKLPAAGERAPPSQLPRQVMSTTRFFRNRIQHQTALRACKGNRVLLVGCSRGCEAYALAIEAQLMSRTLTIEAIDYDAENIREAMRNRYAGDDFIDFDGTSVLSAEVLPYFEDYPDGRRVRIDLLYSAIDFQTKNMTDIKPDYDLIMCNNVLIHFSHSDSLAALERLANCLAPGGVLAIGGANIDIVSAFVQARGLAPICDNITEIWDSWKGDRLSWRNEPERYVAMPPLDKNLPDWNFRFCTLFRKPHAASGNKGENKI